MPLTKQSGETVHISPRHDNWICPECQHVRSSGLDREENSAYCCWCMTLFINIKEV